MNLKLNCVARLSWSSRSFAAKFATHHQAWVDSFCVAAISVVVLVARVQAIAVATTTTTATKKVRTQARRNLHLVIRYSWTGSVGHRSARLLDIRRLIWGGGGGALVPEHCKFEFYPPPCNPLAPFWPKMVNEIGLQANACLSIH